MQTTPAESAKVYQACNSCKSRKRKCDGVIPTCTNCTARGVECVYAAKRRMRGPGKRKECTIASNSQLSSSIAVEGEISTSSEVTVPLPNDIVEDGFSRVEYHLESSRLIEDASQHQIALQAVPALFPDFLLPGTFDEHLSKFRRLMAETIPTRNYTPLMPHQMARRMIENSFVEMMAEHQIISLSNIMTLLEAQYATSSSDPGADYPRWALTNAIIALGMRAKIAPGAESTFSDIMMAFYDNATRVLPELILQEATLLSIQALLAMAMFAQCIHDIRAFVMLATNASRQLQLIGLSWSLIGTVTGVGDSEQYEYVYKTVNAFDKMVAGILDIRAALPES